MLIQKEKYSSDKSFRARTIMAVLGVSMSKRGLKEAFEMDEWELDALIEEANVLSEMKCANALYSFSSQDLPEEVADLKLQDLIGPLYHYCASSLPEFEDYKQILNNAADLIGKTKSEYAFLSLQVGRYAEKLQDYGLAISLYRYTTLLAEELDYRYRKRIYVQSVLSLSKLEFMRGISPDQTLEFQRRAVEMVNQSNLTAEDALLFLYAGMGEHFGGCLEEGELLRNRGIRYLKQFDYSEMEREALTLMGWHYYLEGDFKKAIAYYESFILAIENREAGDVITFAYPPIIFSYFFIREQKRALALADIIYKHALRNKDRQAANLIYAIIGRVYLYLEALEPAEKILKEAYEEGKKIHYGWGMYYSMIGLSFLELKRGDYQACKETILKGREIAAKYKFRPIVSSPFMLEAIKKIKESGLEEISDYNYDDELRKWLNSNSEHLRGIAHRHLALIKHAEGESVTEVLNYLTISVECIEASGDLDELRESYLQMAMIYYEIGDFSRTAACATQCWNYSSSKQREEFPPSLLQFTKREDAAFKLKLELETMWLELRNIIDEEMLETRLITGMCRLFGMESASFAVVKQSGIEIKFAQNLDRRNKKSWQYQQMEGIISQVVVTGKVFAQYDESTANKFNAVSEEQSPVFCMAIPFKCQGRVDAVLYLQSYFGGIQIKPEEYSLLEDFGEKMGEPINAAFHFDKIISQAASIEPSGEYGHAMKSKERFCASMDEDISFIRKQIDKVAQTNIPVLITGETGVGKEVFAREVYEKSGYKRTFIKVNCGAIPESLIESELFGYEKGSFTGAAQLKKGYFEMAEGGTIFLDEVGEMSLNAQVKLLRILQEHELMRVGGTALVKVDFRLIAATNKDLGEEVRKGNFRKDLYYRLNVVKLSIPPLRNRKKDIPNLANFFIQKHCAGMGRPLCTISPEGVMNMLSYHWPGNVRELENTIQRAVLFADNGVIHLQHLGEDQIEEVNSPDSESERRIAALPAAAEESSDTEEAFHSVPLDLSDFCTLEEMERRYILLAVGRCSGKIGGRNGAAQLLGLKRTTLISKMNKLGIGKEP